MSGSVTSLITDLKQIWLTKSGNGNKSVCASRTSVAVECMAPVISINAILCTLASFFMIPQSSLPLHLLPALLLV